MKKDGELKIEKGIQVPAAKTGKGYYASMCKMKVGDSVVIPGIASVAHNAARFALRPGCYTTRKVEGGYRVWRTA